MLVVALCCCRAVVLVNGMLVCLHGFRSAWRHGGMTACWCGSVRRGGVLGCHRVEVLYRVGVVVALEALYLSKSNPLSQTRGVFK